MLVNDSEKYEQDADSVSVQSAADVSDVYVRQPAATAFRQISPKVLVLNRKSPKFATFSLITAINLS